MEQLITILGPTAVGKTDLTLQLAQQLTTSIISGDAYQIYKELNIGSAKPSKKELSMAPHYLVDCYDPTFSYSVVDFQREASQYIQEINGEHKIPILSGGTGLYVQALLEGYRFSNVGKSDDLRNELETLYKREGIEGLRAYAQKLGNELGVEVRTTDKHRLFRTIELLVSGDAETVKNQTKAGLVYEGPVIGLMRPREELYARINLRVDLMVKQGLFEEVEGLLKKGLSKEMQSLKGIGYKELIPYFEGQISKEDAIRQVKQNTRNFAKRQITWYKRMPYINWIHIDQHITPHKVYEAALQILRDYKIIE